MRRTSLEKYAGRKNTPGKAGLAAKHHPSSAKTFTKKAKRVCPCLVKMTISIIIKIKYGIQELKISPLPLAAIVD